MNNHVGNFLPRILRPVTGPTIARLGFGAEPPSFYIFLKVSFTHFSHSLRSLSSEVCPLKSVL